MKPRLRECYTCGELRDPSQFYGYATQCKPCLACKRKLRIAADPEKYAKQNRTNCARYRSRLIKKNTAQ